MSDNNLYALALKHIKAEKGDKVVTLKDIDVYICNHPDIIKDVENIEKIRKEICWMIVEDKIRDLLNFLKVMQNKYGQDD